MNINPITEMKPQKRNYERDTELFRRHNNEKPSIIAGLSDEARKYVQQAVNRQGTDYYSIFNEEGLMPETLDEAVEKMGQPTYTQINRKTKLPQTKTLDEMVLINQNKDGSQTVLYDSNSDGMYDRTATYILTSNYFSQFDKESLGDGMFRSEEDLNKWMKVSETFDADGNGVDEVRLTRYPSIIEKMCEEEKGFIIKRKEIVLKAFEDHTDYSIKVNRDNKGYDKLNGYHWEYEESNIIGTYSREKNKSKVSRTEWIDDKLSVKREYSTEYYDWGNQVESDLYYN